MWNSTFRNRPKPLARNGRLKLGKKTKAWIKARAKVKKRLLALNITNCELNYDGCWKDNALSIAHGRKRRLLKDDELESLTILACTPCHDILESGSHEEMLLKVQEVIARRLV